MFRTASPDLSVLPAPVGVRLLTEADRPALETLFALAPERFLTARANVESFGFADENVPVRGAFGADDRTLCGVLIRFNNTFVAVDTDGRCGLLFARLLEAQAGIAGIRGARETVRAITPHLRRYRVNQAEDSFFLRLETPPQVRLERLRLARLAAEADLERLTALYANAGIMYRSQKSVASKLAMGRVFVVEESPIGRHYPRLLSCALLNVEGYSHAVIGGVYTLAEARGKGFASACVAALAHDLQKDGKTPCLFYENPVAGRIYRKMGFVDADRWLVAYLQAQR